MTENELGPLGLSRDEWRAFWISLAANAVLFLAIANFYGKVRAAR